MSLTPETLEGPLVQVLQSEFKGGLVTPLQDTAHHQRIFNDFRDLPSEMSRGIAIDFAIDFGVDFGVDVPRICPGFYPVR